MRIRRIAILIDGAFFLKRLNKLNIQNLDINNAKSVSNTIYRFCKYHVSNLVFHKQDRKSENTNDRWLEHVYRIFYYDAQPFAGKVNRPLNQKLIDYRKSSVYQFRNDLFNELRRKRKFVLRLGEVIGTKEWAIRANKTKDLLKIVPHIETMKNILQGDLYGPTLEKSVKDKISRALEYWEQLKENDVELGLKQKGVDMHIGVDIASMTLKKQVDTIILVTGDSDFVPAAKLARREGVEFLLDPLGFNIADDLHEHIDGIVHVYNVKHSDITPKTNEENHGKKNTE